MRVAKLSRAKTAKRPVLEGGEASPLPKVTVTFTLPIRVRDASLAHTDDRCSLSSSQSDPSYKAEVSARSGAWE